MLSQFNFFLSSLARGFALRASMMLLVIALLASSAMAGSLTFSTLEGAYSQSGVSFQVMPDNTRSFYSYGALGSNGYIRGTNGFSFDLNCGTSYVSCAINGFNPASGYFFGLALDQSFTPMTLIGNMATSAVLTFTSAIDIFAFDGVNFTGINNSTNQTVLGDFATFLSTGNFVSMPLPTNASSAAGTALSGNIVCTTNGDLSGLATTARCYNKTTGAEITIDRGTSSVTRGANEAFGIVYGGRNGCAGFWSLATGAFSPAPNASGSGCQAGEVTSWTPGGFWIRNGNEEFLWRPSVGNTITAQAFYLGQIVGPVPRNTVLAGDSVTSIASGEGSLKSLYGPTGELLYRESTAEVPEPGPIWLVGLGLASLVYLRRREIASKLRTRLQVS